MPCLLPLSRASILLCLSVILGACGARASAAPSQSPIALGTQPRVHLPADQAAHAAAQNEWWYVVGHLHSGTRTFGFETTIFKFKNIRAPGLAAPISLFRTDVAITDEGAGQFHNQVTYHFPGSAQLSTTTLAAKVGSASLTGSAPSSMHLVSHLPAGSLDLRLSSRRVAMNVGGNGYIGFGNGFTYYYSLTDIATQGTLRVGGHTYSVSGVSWLDHQWGNWSWSGIHGWTWMALQLDNGVQLSLFDVRGGKRVRLASVLPVDGQVRTDYGITITPRATWLSPHTHGLYPSGWTVLIPAVHANLRVVPTVRDQELAVPNQAQGSYWEGSGRIVGTWQGKHVRGLSYTELTGYAGSHSGLIPGT